MEFDKRRSIVRSRTGSWRNSDRAFDAQAFEILTDVAQFPKNALAMLAERWNGIHSWLEGV